jgi:uncharacterized protein
VDEIANRIDAGAAGDVRGRTDCDDPGRRAGRVLASIHLYPVKSLAGGAVAQAQVEPWGLRHDRRWLLLGPDGNVVTARDHHGTLGVTATPDRGGAIMLAARDGSKLRVPEPSRGELLQTSLSRLESVRAAGAEADAWLSARLGLPLRLGWLDEPRRRSISEAHGGRPGEYLNLSDAGPLLLTTSASLRQLDRWAAEGAARRNDPAPAPLAMARFRPTVVVEGRDEPFAEDGWKSLQIGPVAFRFGEQCDRCAMTTIDPETGRAGKEPLRTLATHRRRDRKTWFGIRIIPTTTGSIELGDRVVVAPA